jgi:hypothetical protein
MPAADVSPAASAEQGAPVRSLRPRHRRIATAACLFLIGALGLALTQVPIASASSPQAADAEWPAFAQTASDATTWLTTTNLEWPAFTQTASDASTWLIALRSFATAVTDVVRNPPVVPTAPPAHTVAIERSPSPPPSPPPPPAYSGLPAVGQATAWGCDAALAYLSAYAAPGFSFECPGYAEGHEGMTCMNEPGVCPGENLIAINNPCPQAYMNEASNSWVAVGLSDAPIDPYGSCR